mmetsp:Transcript_23516/g.50039  ORF Transcript_23516/g.50039 Transcript_23516/m.50039 type:complete len:211 (-) Transcript_23516:263-895(-)
MNQCALRGFFVVDHFFENTALFESEWPLVVPKHLLVVIEDNHVGELVHESGQDRLIVFGRCNVENPYHAEQIGRVSGHETGIEVHVSDVLAHSLDAGLVEGTLTLKVHPGVDVLVLFPEASRVTGRTRTLGSLLGDGVEILGGVGVCHGRDAALALGGHDHGIGFVRREFVVGFDEPIDGLVGSLFVLRQVEGDIAGVSDHNQFFGIDDL